MMNLKAVIFDWAGTIVDFGSLCPVLAFQSAFAARGVVVQAAQIHQFMGVGKREHVESVLALPEVARNWELANESPPTPADAEALYLDAEKRILETIHEFATPTPHVEEAMEMIRGYGLKIGSTSGYTSSMVNKLASAARLKGFAPDTWVASDEVSKGRPYPWMIFKNMERLEVCPPGLIVKIGDTLPDIAEGLNAGTWTVMVVESSSLVGKSMKELEEMPRKKKEMMFKRVRKQFAEAGAHFVINDLSELEEVLQRIELNLESGMRPPKGRRRKIAFA